MDTNKWIMLLIGVMVGGLILASFVPVFVSVQEKTGDEVTYTNYITSTNQYRYDYVDSVELTAIASETEGVNYDYVINGQTITLINDYMLAIVSDGFALQIGTNGQFAYSRPSDPYAATTNPNPTTYPTVTLTMANGEWSLMGGETELSSGTYSWLVTYVENGKYVAHNSSVVNAYCYGNPEDFIVYGSNYTSGELDTFYAYGKGTMSWGVNEYDAKLNWTSTLVDGTTDIYKVTTCDITVTDGENSETFTPYRCLYLYEVNGHKASGTMYDLLGLLPLIAGVGLLLFATIEFLKRYY